MTKFQALVVDSKSEGSFTRQVRERSTDDLPDNDVLIKVRFSSLNYKDALSASGNRGVTRIYPHTPGIDATGIIVNDRSHTFREGQNVIVTGYDLGMDTDGGFEQFIKVPTDWVLPLPGGMTLLDSMRYGTAGLTAAVSVDRLQHEGILPGDGEILVSGATGGVGSLAVALLAELGYSVTAATGKMHEQKFLKFLGANRVINRRDIEDSSEKPLLKGRWKGAVDTVGGNVLATIIRSTTDYGVVTCCGNVQDYRFNCNVYPFILRGVTLAGVESASLPMVRRQELWQRLAGDWKINRLASLTRTVTLDSLDEEIDKMLNGRQVGRVVVDLQGPE